MTKRAYTKLTPKQRIAIMAQLEMNLIHKDDGIVKYAAYASDASLATKLGVPEAQVRSIRSQFFGKLKPSHDFIKYGELVDRLRKLEQIVDSLSKASLDAVSRGHVTLGDPSHGVKVPAVNVPTMNGRHEVY